jgi:hypothetical protein
MVACKLKDLLNEKANNINMASIQTCCFKKEVVFVVLKKIEHQMKNRIKIN